MLKTKTAAARLGVTSVTLRRWVKGGWGPPAIQAPGGTWRFNEADLVHWIRDHRQVVKPWDQAD